MIALLGPGLGEERVTRHFRASAHRRRAGAVAGALCLALSIGACDAPTEGSARATATGKTKKGIEGTQTKKASGTKKQKSSKQKSSDKGKSFTVPPGTVTVRRLGFDNLRIVGVKAQSGWRGRIDDNFDDDVQVVFRRGRQRVDFDAGLEDGRLRVESCEELSRLRTRPAIGGAGIVTLRRLGDEELHVSIVDSSPGWRPRVTDNNSEDIEVLFVPVSGKGRIEFDAQLDDGRLEGTICRALS
jgi:hypothetical protein